MPEGLSKDYLMGLAREWQKSRVFLTACELDIFSNLNEFKSSKKLAEELELSERHTDRLLNALVVLGLLEKRDNMFKNTEISNTYLDKKSENYLLGLPHSCHLFYSWAFLTDVVKTGKPSRMLNPNLRQDNWVEDFISAMQQFASERAPKLVDMIDFSGVKKFLDLGGGSGANSVEVAKRYPDIKVVIFDLPDVIPLTKKYVSSAGGFSNIEFIEGDYFKDNIGNGYDVILLSNIIHAHGFEEVKKIFDVCGKALNKGGKIVVQEFVVDEERVSPPNSVFFSLNMLVNTERGDTYTEREIKELFKETGFLFVSNKPTGLNSNVIIGRKI